MFERHAWLQKNSDQYRLCAPCVKRAELRLMIGGRWPCIEISSANLANVSQCYWIIFIAYVVNVRVILFKAIAIGLCLAIAHE